MKSYLPLIFTSFLAVLLAQPGFGQKAATASAITFKIASPIGSHMVLQQGKPTSVWGTAKPDSQITVAFAGQNHKAKADADGNWSVTLDALKLSKEGQKMTVTSTHGEAKESTTFEDVLVGEVWMCSGQSNMGWTLNRAHNAEEAIKSAKYPHMRLFKTKLGTSAEVTHDVVGKWEMCTPETAAGFSAVGYFFGRELAEELDGTPIGLINTAWGGKPSEAFTSREKLETINVMQPLIEEFESKQAKYDPAKASANYDTQIVAWEKNVKEMKEKAKKAPKKEGEPPVRLPRKPVYQGAPNLQPNYPASIYNDIIAPWTHYAVQGAIWYQGESNARRAVQYRDIFPAMIEDWRDQWSDDLSFYFVQLANFKEPVKKANQESSWAELQEAQAMALRLPKTGMAIVNDIGEAKNIHPGNKEDVGKRLARWALKHDYGKAIDPVSGPIYKSHAVEGSTIRVQFDHAGKGLKAHGEKSLGGFEVAGEDGVYVWADAKIADDGKSVVASSKQVAKPVSVRYAWAANPTKANLVNSADLPTSLFRTDDHPRVTEGSFTLAASAKVFDPRNVRRKNAELEKLGWTVLFDGFNTDSWKNPYDFGNVKVVAGEIHLEANKKFFLATKETFGDFHFSGEVKLPEGPANSGFMFRCHVEPGKVYGYQAEVDGSDRRWSGGLYDEGRRKWVWPSMKGKSKPEFLAHSEKSLAHFATDKVRNALKRNDWNRYEIVCKGNSITIKVNGVVTTNIKDDVDASGHIAIQHHGEEGAVYKFRNLMVRELK